MATIKCKTLTTIKRNGKFIEAGKNIDLTEAEYKQAGKAVELYISDDEFVSEGDKKPAKKRVSKAAKAVAEIDAEDDDLGMGE